MRRLAPLLDLAREEGVAVAGDERLRSPGARAYRSGSGRGLRMASRPARPVTWLRSWKVRSAARGSACARPRSRVDHADQSEPREVMALGHELGADDDIDLAVLDLAQGLAQIAYARREVARQQHAARIGEALRDLLGDALDARPARHERMLGPAIRAASRESARTFRNGGIRGGGGIGARRARPSSSGIRSGSRICGRA